MYMNRSLPLADARKQFSGIVDEVVATHERVVVTRHGEPAILMVSVADYEAMQETMEILSDKKLLTDIQKSLKSTKRYTLDQAKVGLRKRSKA